jgi:hypothetical protein
VQKQFAATMPAPKLRVVSKALGKTKTPAHSVHSNTFTTLEAGFSKALPATFNQQTLTEGSRTTK